jgi:quercetin dioxygenase-like cupin family protein
VEWVFYNAQMRTLKVAGMGLLCLAGVGQPRRVVDITSEPSHHLVFENQYLRAFDVIVAPKTSTLVHRHDHDYVFVTLGDSDLTNARVGEKPAGLQLKDGDTRFTPGGFAHAAINNSDRPFHNITIDLLQTATNVKPCTESCSALVACDVEGKSLSFCPTVERRITSDQWVMSFVTMPPGSALDKHTHTTPHLVVAVSDVDLTVDTGAALTQSKLAVGGVAWVPAGVTHSARNNTTNTQRFVTLEFAELKK